MDSRLGGNHHGLAKAIEGDENGTRTVDGSILPFDKLRANVLAISIFIAMPVWGLVEWAILVSPLREDGRVFF